MPVARKREPEADVICTVSDAAQVLRVSESTVRNYADGGTLPVFGRTMSGTRLFKFADVERLAAERRRGPRAASKPPVE